MSKAISELNALTEALHIMRNGLKFSHRTLIYQRFCKRKGTMKITYLTLAKDNIYAVEFWYISWLGHISRLAVKVI